MDLWKECDVQENRFIEHVESCDDCRGPHSTWSQLCPRGKNLHEVMTRAQELCVAGVPVLQLRPWQKRVA